jgi:hypothetical protein
MPLSAFMRKESRSERIILGLRIVGRASKPMNNIIIEYKNFK